MDATLLGEFFRVVYVGIYVYIYIYIDIIHPSFSGTSTTKQLIVESVLGTFPRASARRWMSRSRRMVWIAAS
jgi:hypothetical protein